MGIIKIDKIKYFYPPWMNTDASIHVYKFRPERTGFNMYAEYTQPQLTFLALVPCSNVIIYGLLDFKKRDWLEMVVELRVHVL